MTYVWNKARDRAIRNLSTPKSTVGAQMIARPCGYCGQRPHAPKCPVPRYEEPEDGVIEMPTNAIVQVPREFEAIHEPAPAPVALAAPPSLPVDIEALVAKAAAEQFRQLSQQLARQRAAELEHMRQMGRALAIAEAKVAEFKSKPDFVWNEATQCFHEVIYDQTSGRASLALPDNLKKP